MTAPTLDAEQNAAATVAPSERQLVVAGPGAGKTEVVSALLAHLVVDEELEPGLDVLVVTFSRAAVEAVKRRLRTADVQAGAAVHTLDALAARIVGETSDQDVGRMSFDDRVKRATGALLGGLWEPAGDMAHVVVDEVQDVVGIRADFLLALLDQVPGDAGFTLLGDPAQAIYDFQLDGPSATTNDEFLRRATGLSEVVERRLTGNYRASTREARRAAGLREGAAANLGDARDTVRGFVESLVPMELDELPPILTLPGETSAVLAPDNGRALLIAHELWERGVRATLRRPAREPVIDRWVAETLPGRPTWTRDELLAAHDDDEVAAARWRDLRGVVRPRGGTIDTSAVAARLARGALPPEIAASEVSGQYVSTIHRAKGLEFDTVVLSRYQAREDEDVVAATRLAYVAITRARVRLCRMDGPTHWALRIDRRSGRWYVGGKSPWETYRLELRGDDLDRSVPPGEDRESVQEHLRLRVQQGDPLDLVLDHMRSTLMVPIWKVLHRGVEIGATSEHFGRELAARVGPPSTRRPPTLAWPALLGARVESIATVVGEPQRSEPGPVGRYGMWLSVRAVGLLQLRWRADT
ncbi:UvrD-helicase domain-containing protein [Actinotalea subterranea]|uniref:UvrD-helicase domain-containing protein n=1 Tax=Actinotalea subterranea TaxID=2607497 RepID=UPI0011F05B8C|nr:UvrD-helicase domain-containing protein [Actinotalea subterranea]